MFTGIVRDIGEIEFLVKNENSLKLIISTQLEKSYFALGASVACNGCCLTVVEFFSKDEKNFFTVDIGYQSLQLTQFGNMGLNSKVNVEPALRVGDSLGGHHVSGHVDVLCNISKLEGIANGFWQLKLIIPKEFVAWVIPKGSIAVAGISLTIAEIEHFSNGDAEITIMIIPHTYKNTILHNYKANMQIEIEFDQAIKTIASIVKNMLPSYIQARK